MEHLEEFHQAIINFSHYIQNFRTMFMEKHEPLALPAVNPFGGDELTLELNHEYINTFTNNATIMSTNVHDIGLRIAQDMVNNKEEDSLFSEYQEIFRNNLNFLIALLKEIEMCLNEFLLLLYQTVHPPSNTAERFSRRPPGI